MSPRFWPWGKQSSQTTPLFDDNSFTSSPYIQRAPSPRRNSPGLPVRRGFTSDASAHGIPPSRSVEPPRVAGFSFTTSPSPAQYVAAPQALKRTDSELQSIPETIAEPSHPQPQNEMRDTPGRRASQDDPYISGFQLVPRTSVMNPDAFKLPILANSGPRPPGESVMHAEVTRHGGTYVPINENPVAEALYQADVTPPLKPQKLPAAIIIDPRFVSEPSTKSQDLNPMHAPSRHGGVYVGDSSKPLDSTLAPPVANLPMNSPLVNTAGAPPAQIPRLAEKAQEPPAFYDTTRPTCSLNLVCYRSGGCDLQQIHCVLHDMFSTERGFEETIRANQQLVYNDRQFFSEMRRLYRERMCGFFRQYFSLKTLRAFRVLSYTPTSRPTVVPFDDFVLQEMMYAYRNPEKILTAHDQDTWIRWVFRLRRKDRRHALEFVEGWNTTRIAIAGTLPWLSSCLVGVIWTATGGDAQTAFTVASFILTSSSIVLALLAIISSIESSGGLSR